MAARRRGVVRSLGTLVDGLERVRDRVTTLDGQLARTYRFGARDLRVSARGASAAYLPDDGLARSGGGHCAVDLFILDELDVAALTFPRDAVQAPYGALIDSVSTDWLILHNIDSHKVLAYDTVNRVGLYYPGLRVAPRDRAEFCRALLHWLAVLEGNVVIHAAGVGFEGRGLLVAGAGNAGKSTLTRFCVASGFEFLGDNVVEARLSGEASPVVYPTYPTFKVRRDAAVPVPNNWPQPSWDDEAEKDIYFLDEGVSALADGALAHAATLILDVEGPAEPVPVSAARAFFLMAPNTVAQFPLFEEIVLKRTGAVVGSAPVFTAGRMPLGSVVGLVESLMLASHPIVHVNRGHT